MAAQLETTDLGSLEYIAYLDENGSLPEILDKIGVYAIFDRERNLQFVGYSRDIYLSLRQHLVRQPQNCYWLKVKTVSRPSRTILEEIRQKWLEQRGEIPPGNSWQESQWTQPIDVRSAMTESEKISYEEGEELDRIKLLKQISRRVESEIQENLRSRGATLEIRFNPKLKERGLLDLK